MSDVVSQQPVHVSFPYSNFKRGRSIIQNVWHRLQKISLELKILLPVVSIAFIMLPLSLRTASQPTETGSKASEVSNLEQGRQYYVAPNGSANSDCDRISPCDTLETVLSLPGIGTEPGDTVLFLDGTYHGQQKVLNKHFSHPVLVSAANPYRAKLQNNGVVLTLRNAYNVHFMNFEMRQVEPIPVCNTGDTSAYIIQLSDSSDSNGPFGAKRGPDNSYYDSASHYFPNGTDYSGEITFENKIIHDSYCEDHIKVQNGGNIRIIGNMFYNQATRNNAAGNTQNGGTPEEFLDLNSVFNVSVRKNIFFNEFLRPAEPGAFIVVKDSSLGVPDGNTRFGLTNQSGEVVAPHPNGNTFAVNPSSTSPGTRTDTCNPAGSNCDTVIGANAVTIDSNIFLNYSNTSTQYPLLQFGAEDTIMYILNHGVVENNLFLGNSASIARALFELEGVRYFTFRHNTITGNFPSRYFGYRWKSQDFSQKFPNSDVTVANNIWSDPTGTMGAEDGPAEFGRAEQTTITAARTLRRNLFWNNGNAIPANSNYVAQYLEDLGAVIADPGLANPAPVRTPVWEGTQFRNVQAGGTPHRTIAEVHQALVQQYGIPTNSVIDTADASLSTQVDILGRQRTGPPDIGAYETNPLQPTPTPLPSPIPTPTPEASPTPQGTTLKFNFQPANAPVPGGFIADSGERYGRRNGHRYGWNGDNRDATRQRNSSESQLRDTLIHMQPDDTYRWDLQVPNGTYQVSIMAGDPSYTDSLNSLRVENAILLDDGQDNFDYYTTTVVVTDGKLTVRTAPGAVNAKLNYILITPQ